VQTKEKDKEKRKEEKNNYLPFSAAAEGEHIHTLIYIESNIKKRTHMQI
jgi:hypothetical protein